MGLSEFVYEIISAYILSRIIYPKYQASSKFTIKKKKPKQNKIKGKWFTEKYTISQSWLGSMQQLIIETEKKMVSEKEIP